MKKLLIITLVLLSLVLTGCGKKKNPEPTGPMLVTEEPTTEATTAPTTEPTTAPTTEPTTEPTTAPTTAPTQETKPQQTIASVQFTGFVTNAQQLNVRSQPNAASNRLGGLFLGTEVEVNGSVQENGVDIGWYRINYDGKTAYVAAMYVGKTKPTAQSMGIKLTTESFTLFTEDKKQSIQVYKATDGNWYDTDGRRYQPSKSGKWTCEASTTVWWDTFPDDTPATVPSPPADWQETFEKKLWEEYEVKPERYEEIDTNIYQVYVRVNDELVPYVVVNAMTGDFHG